jgi:hypothetical protein
MPGQTSDGIGVAFPGPLRIPVQLHVFQHPSSQIRHGNPPLVRVDETCLTKRVSRRDAMMKKKAGNPWDRRLFSRPMALLPRSGLVQQVIIHIRISF